MQIKFFRIDDKENNYEVVKVEGVQPLDGEPNMTEVVLFKIPKDIPDAKMIAKHVTNSVKKGDVDFIYVGQKEIDENGLIKNDTTKMIHKSEAINHIRLGLNGFGNLPKN